tara:strand:+ start:1226 stop:3976 length:2751 start_codon:yes stop_codon:yes gene_type:complete
MANMESFNFDTSATNYAEVSYDGSKVANQALAETDKIYAAHYERMKQDAIKDAETRSRNYTKLGKLIPQAVKFKEKLDAWNDSKSLKSDLTEGTSAKGGEEVQTGKVKDKTKEIEIQQEKELKQLENQTNVEGEIIKSQEVAANNVAGASKDQAISTYDAIKISNIDTYNENSAASSRKHLNTASTFVAKNLNAAVGNAMVPGANGRSYNQLLEAGEDALAEEALFFWGRSALVQSGALTTLKGRHKDKLLKDLRKNIDGITTKSMNRRIEEELKLGEVKEVLNLSNMLVNNPEGISEYVFGTPDDPNSGLLTKLSAGAPGGPDATFGMAKLGDRLEKAFEQNLIGMEELQLLRDTLFVQKGTKGKTTTIAGLNTDSGRLLDRKLGGLIQKAQKKELTKIENERKINAEQGITSLIEGYRAQNKDGRPVTLEQKEKDIAKLAKDLGLSTSDPLLKRLNDYYVPGDYDDEEEAQWLLADIRRDGKIDGGDLEGRLSAIENGDIRKATKKKAEALLAGFEPSDKHTKDAAKIFNAMSNVTADGTVLDPDKASEVALGIQANMMIDYEELYAEGFAVSQNATKAHNYALNKIKLNHRDEKQFIEADVDGVKKMVSKYTAPNMGEADADIQSSMLFERTIDMLNKDQEGTLNSSGFLMGEAKALPIAIRALKNNTGVIPEYYLNLSRKTGIHPLKLMKMRMEAMDIDPKEADPNKVYFVDFPDDDLSENDKKRLNTFPTPSNVVQIMSQDIYSDDAKNTIFYDQMARQGADHDSFIDTRGRTYKINITEQSISNVGNMFNNNKSRTGIQYGAKVKVGKYDWNKNTFEAALERSGIDPSEPFTKENQDALLRAHQANILYSDNMLSSLEAFGGDTELTSYEPVSVDFDTAAAFSEEFGTDPFMQPNSLSTGLFNTYFLIEQ